jgi:hypothetical protein
LRVLHFVIFEEEDDPVDRMAAGLSRLGGAARLPLVAVPLVVHVGGPELRR